MLLPEFGSSGMTLPNDRSGALSDRLTGCIAGNPPYVLLHNRNEWRIP